MTKFHITGYIREISSSAGGKHQSNQRTKAMLAKKMPNLVRHAGHWEGKHHHIDGDGNILSQHKSQVECISPTDGSFHYIHKETITWKNGRQEFDIANAIFLDQRLWLKNEKFEGNASELESGVILFDLIRCDNKRSSLKEMLSLDASEHSCSRAISWFEDGHLVKRSLCNEQRVN